MVSTRLMAGATGPSSSEHLVSSRQGGPQPQQQQQQPPPVQQIFLLDLPLELLDKIFAYVGYKKVAQMRIVSRQMNQVSSLVLNSTFQKLQNQIMIRFQNVKAKMPRRESARRNHHLATECDIIETCHMRLSLLQMTFGKHIERKHCCFFPGGILDEVYNVLNHVRVMQEALGRPYKVTDELFDLSTMAMEYFKEHIEPGLPDLVYFSPSFLDFSSNAKTSFLESSPSSSSNSFSNVQPSPPHMVLRKGIRKIKQGMKRYNNQLTVLRTELRSCKKKATEQSKQMAEQQKLIADQQKQTIDRLDENDKKNEEMSRKFSTMLQELNKCKTELQYWRSTSAAPVTCSGCGQVMIPLVNAPATSVEVDSPHTVRQECVEGGVGMPLKRKLEEGGEGGAAAAEASNVNNSVNCSNILCADEAIVNTTSNNNKKARRSAKAT